MPPAAPGEVGFLPLPGTPLVRDVRRGNAGGFQELAGGRQVLALARSLGIRATTPDGRRRQGARPARAPATSCSRRWPSGSRSASPPWSPWSTPPWSCWPAACSPPAATGCSDLIADELGSLAAAQPRLELSSVHDRPVLAGALQTALEATRDEVFDTVQQPAPQTSSTARQERRAP